MPADKNWEQYLHWPWIDVLRREIGPDSAATVYVLIKSPERDFRILGIAACKQLQYADECRDDIRRLLQHTWDNYSDYDTRWWTMFRLFEYSDLTIATHKEAFAFVTHGHWKRWSEDCIRHFGGAERILSVIADRPGVASAALSKSWSRILQTAGSHDRQAALTLARRISQVCFGDPLVREAFDFVSAVNSREIGTATI